MSTWSEDFTEAMAASGLPFTGSAGAEEVMDLLSNLTDYISMANAENMPAIEALEAMSGILAVGTVAMFAEAAALAVGVTAVVYTSAVISAALYASAHQAWDWLAAPIDLGKLLAWAEQYQAPVIQLPATEAPEWYPSTEGAMVESPPAAPAYLEVISWGSSNVDAVEWIQNALAARGYAVAIDGDFGEETYKAVSHFQEDNGLHVDGEVGSDTWAALFA